MRETFSVPACLLALTLTACGGGQQNDTAGGAGTGAAETGTAMDTTGMGGGMSDSSPATGTTGMSDTGTGTTGGAGRSDSAKGNQTESGVTNTQTGKATTGPGVTQTRPDQGAAATSKGDTLNRSVDSAQH
jgi:hypothetical protein